MYSPVRVGRVHQLGDPLHALVAVRDDLHLLVGEVLHGVEGEDDLLAVAAGGEQGLLDGDRVHGVAVGEHHALLANVTGAPQGVGVVPLLGLVVVDEGELEAVLLLQRRLALVDGLLAVADDDRDLGEADLGEVRAG